MNTPIVTNGETKRTCGKKPKRARRTLDQIPAADLLDGKISSAEAAAITAEISAPRVKYGSLRPAFEAMVRAAADYAKLPWPWLDRVGYFTVAEHEAETFSRQLAEGDYKRGRLHFALNALAIGFERREVKLRKGDEPDQLMWACRFESIATLRRPLDEVFVLDGTFEELWPYLKRYHTPKFLKRAMSYEEIFAARPGGGPDLSPTAAAAKELR